MPQKKSLSAADHYEVVTAPTSNEMFDNGAWLAPVLTSVDPEVDVRVRHAIHFFAEDTRLSVCGKRFGPDHYIETAAGAHGEPRKRCVDCMRVRAAVTVAATATATAKGMPVTTPSEDVYSVDDFRRLIAGTRRLRMRVNRVATVDGDLYLMVDNGFVPARSLRHDLKQTLLNVDEVVLVWAEETALEYEARRAAEARASADAALRDVLRQREQLDQDTLLARLVRETVDS